MGEAKLRREREEGRQMRGTCQSCEHFSALQKECREGPRQARPMVGPNGQPGVFSYWPNVETNHWCGKHKPDAQSIAGAARADALASFVINGAGT